MSNEGYHGFKYKTKLSPREREVLEDVREGLSNGEIGSKLGISLATVRNYVRQLMQKLEARNRTECVIKAIRSGQLDLYPEGDFLKQFREKRNGCIKRRDVGSFDY